MRFTLDKISAFVLSLVVLVGMAGAQQKSNPRTQINWPMVSGSGTPTAQGFTCSAVNYGMPYTDTSTTPNTLYSCGSDGWVIRAGGIGTPYSGVASDGAAGLTVQANLKAATVNASVNTQLNVMSYGAKGDCSTDDTAAFSAAQTAALAYQTGNSLPAALYLPKAPGGCYIVSNWTWKGVSLLGPAITGLAAASPYQSAVTLKSKPGQDVLHVPDPTYTTGTITVNPGWAIENVSFIADNSVAGSFPHRWPGRWFDDGAITSGSAVFTSTNAKITCGDVGQAIQINGAGPSGGNMVTTIQSVSPCWIPSTQSGVTSWQVVTLAAAASTTVTNAHSYISVLGLPVTENIGNCAIAFDMADGNRADWVGTTAGGNYGRMDNVTFATTNGQNNDVCGIFTQGNPYFYGLRVDNFAFYNQKFAVVQTASEFNSLYESNAGDFQQWNHGIFFLPWNPWISINGLSNKLKHVQYNTKSGVQIMQLANNAFDSATGWDIDLGGEAPSGATVYGHRIDGNDETITGDFAVNGTSEVGYADVNSSTINGDVNNTQLNGFGNTVIAPNITTGVIDNGYGNRVKWIYSGSSSPNGMPLNYWVSGVFCKGYSSDLGCMTPDFLMDGNFTTPYNHSDQLILPKDVVLNPVGGAYTQYIVNDSTAKSGVALIVSGSSPTAYYYAFMQYNELSFSLPGFKVGTNFPTTGGTFVFSAKCPTGSTFTAYAKAATTFSQSFSCTTSYQQYSIPMTFVSGDIGQPLQFGGGAGTNPFYIEWAAFTPQKVLNSPTINAPTVSGGTFSSPSLTGTPTAPTQTGTDNSTKVATTAFVQTAVAGVSGGGASYYDWVIMPGSNAQATSLASPTNTTTVASFTSPTSATYTKITFYVNTADATADLYDIGWYNSSGSLVCHVGATAGTTFAPSSGAFVNLTMASSCVFVAGQRYYLAWTGNASTMKYSCPTNVGVAYRTSAVSGGTTTGGALNSSISPGSDSYTLINPVPWVVMHN